MQLFLHSYCTCRSENKILPEIPTGSCEEYFQHLLDKVAQFCSELDSSLGNSLEVIETCLSPVIWEDFELAGCMEVEKLLVAIAWPTVFWTHTLELRLPGRWLVDGSKKWLLPICRRKDSAYSEGRGDVNPS